MIKDAFTLFLSPQQASLQNELSNQQLHRKRSEAEREINALEVVQVFLLIHEIFSSDSLAWKSSSC
jgi:hypothetical protein